MGSPPDEYAPKFATALIAALFTTGAAAPRANAPRMRKVGDRWFTFMEHMSFAIDPATGKAVDRF